MTYAQIGYPALMVGLVMMAAQFALIFMPRWRHGRYSATVSVHMAFAALSVSFATLIAAFVASDFSLKVVFENSHTLKPMLYKITGTWGNHEGSMLLFIWIFSGVSLLYQWLSRQEEKQGVLAVQGGVALLITLYIALTSNPFAMMEGGVPQEGMGLNPLLQDIGLAFHPPALYAGYTGFSLALSWAVVILLRGEVTRLSARQLRPWMLGTWAVLTLGIGLGSRWAYRELGWGGFWFWDPVENSSLMPWLSGTALLHALAVLGKRGRMQHWVMFLSIITFALSLIGFFLVRSGILTSVHAFASDPARGVFMLAIFALVTGAALLIYMLRAFSLRVDVSEPPQYGVISREMGIALNNVLLMVLLTTIMLGTLYPVISDVIGGVHISVGAPYFNQVFNPIALLLLLLCATFGMLHWKGDAISRLMRFWVESFALSAIIAGVIIWTSDHPSIIAFVALTLASMLTVSILYDITLRLRGGLISKLRSLPPGYVAMQMGHMGVVLAAVSIAMLGVGSTSREGWMREDSVMHISGYDVRLLRVTVERRDNFAARIAEMEVTRNGRRVVILRPESRIYLSGRTTTEAAIYSHILDDIYFAIGEVAAVDIAQLESDMQGGGEQVAAIAVRGYIKPGMRLMWGGVILMALGGLWGIIFGKRNKTV